MNIEVIAIGNEVLSGAIINSNAAFISEELNKEGLRVVRHTVLPDDGTILRDGLKEALQRSSLVICTGGLGPTCDDITRTAAAEIFHSDFRYDEEVAQDLMHRFGECSEALKDQATIPSKAQIFKNSVGTACGLVFHENSRTLILLPGVPIEMKTIWNDSVIPYIRKNYTFEDRLYTKSLNMFGLPESAVDPLLRDLSRKHPTVEFGIYPGQGVLRVNFSSTSQEELEKSCEIVSSQFASQIYDAPSGKLEEAIHHAFIQQKKTLSIAESCTGGSVAARLTQLPGTSQYFLGSIVTYSNEMKIKLLGVSEKTLKEHGAVSAEVVEQMVRGALDKTGSDFAIAVTGIAGPDGGTPDKPVGTVWCAVAAKGKKPHVWLYRTKGSRTMIIERTVNTLLGELLKYLEEITTLA